VTVYTGYSSGSGTTANVCIQLHGSVNTSRVINYYIYFVIGVDFITYYDRPQVHWLYNSDCDVLQRFNDDWFLIFTTKSLGEIRNIHVWHDNYGERPNWYCKRIEVIDVRTKKKWHFNVERRFSFMQSIGNIEHTIFVGSPRTWKEQAEDDLELTIREDHLWASVFIR